MTTNGQKPTPEQIAKAKRAAQMYGLWLAIREQNRREPPPLPKPSWYQTLAVALFIFAPWFLGWAAVAAWLWELVT